MKSQAATDVARDKTILILGPWNHTSLNTRKTKFGEVQFGTNAGVDYDAELISWFDGLLKDKPGKNQLAPVNIFVMGENKWRGENEWPLKRANTTSFYLHSAGKAAIDKNDGTLSTTLPQKEKADSYVFDPSSPLWDVSYEKSYPYNQRENESRSDVAVFTSAPLAADTEVTGEIAIELFVSSSATDTDFSFTLCDVAPDGTSINLHGLDAGYLRMRYRNSLAKQELMKPGEVYKIRIGQVYTANLFRKGHRIRVYVTSSKAPHYDPNPNTGTEIATEKKLIPATNTIYHDAAHPSCLLLPVVPR